MHLRLSLLLVGLGLVAACPVSTDGEGEGEGEDVCASARDCPDSRCVDGACLPVGCVDNTDCAAGNVCSTLQCPAVCTAPATAGDVCLVWSDVSTCAGLPPGGTYDCAAGLVCEAPPVEPTLGGETHCVVAP